MAFVKLTKHGFTPSTTLFADSTCPDEISHDNPEEDIIMMFA